LSLIALGARLFSWLGPGQGIVFVRFSRQLTSRVNQ